ncbi:proline dehydrogenase family protein [Leucobacter sp. CSA1]|uniref:Proline dehydrogenase family protein n=1 Tax=Leucobacter chromiisoli TaxID=2796471 RepID=A0A934Q9Q7_9MICO|nr:proline dehydrogenase family protein [Leucobacter chromiisoli]MBK0419761.1 proline dehydrogenase family protein [Leucobacter chromiisoli]
MAEDRGDDARVEGGIAEAAVNRAAGWIEQLRSGGSGTGEGIGADPLGGARQDADALDFTRRLLDLVIGSDDAFVSALGLRDVSRELPESMPVRDRIAMRAGGIASLGLPWAVLPAARRRLRDRLSHLVLAAKLPSDGGSARAAALQTALRRYTEGGVGADLALRGDAVHGAAGVEREVVRLTALAASPGVTHLVVDPARLAPGGSEWSFHDDVAAAVRALRPVLEVARDHDTAVTLEADGVRWARLAPEVLIRALADPELGRVRAGVAVLAELPESRDILERLARWALDRVAEGGAPAEVVIGVGGVGGAERISSLQSGLPVPVLEGRLETSAQLLRLADLALKAASAPALRPVVASDDPHLIAAAVELAARRGTSGLLAVRLRSGVAPALAELLAGELPRARILLPLTAPQEFGGVVNAVVALTAEATDPESALGRLDALLAPAGDSAEDAALHAETLAAEREHLAAVAAAAEKPFPASRRTQLRAREWDPSERDSALFYRRPDEPARFDTGGLTAAVLGLSRGSTGELRLETLVPERSVPVVSASGFANEPETDAGVAANRDWARALLRRAAEEAATADDVDATVALSRADLDPAAAVAEAREAAEAWSAQDHATRASRLRRTALGAVAARDRLIQALAADTGRPIGELDAEVDDVVDAARYCAQLAEGLATVRGASFHPDRLAMVVSDAHTPLSVQAEAVLAALAAGSAALWAVPPALERSAGVLVEEWEAAGLPRGTARVVPAAAEGTLPALVADTGIDRATVLGDREAARDLARRRPDLRVEGRFHAAGSILVTPSGDVDAAIRDIVASAFVGAGAAPRTAHAVVALGSSYRSKRLREGLADAVRAIRVGDTARPDTADPLGFGLGPLAAPPDEAGLRALTTLGRGEEWLVEPQRLDEAGRLWSPGVRIGVAPDSAFWADSRRVPVIGIVHARTLAEAIALQERVGGGEVAGLQSFDVDEILPWLDRAAAASLVVNRPTTGARIERLPSGGWDREAMGLAPLAGGPNRLVPLGSWRTRSGTRSDTLHLRGLDPEVQLLIEMAQGSLAYEEFDELRRAALGDALVWRTSLGAARDVAGLGVERNVLRHHPVPAQLRLAEGGRAVELLRVVAAALLVRAPVSVSTGEVLPHEVTAFLAKQGIEVSLERDDDWLERLAVGGPTVAADGLLPVGEVRPVEGGGPDGVVGGGAGAADAGGGAGRGAGGGAGRAAGGAVSVPAERVRLIGGDRVRAAEWLGGLDRVALWAEPVTMAGSVELLTLLREQSVAVRAHRHGLAETMPEIDELLGVLGP